MSVLYEPIFSKLYTSEWETDNNNNAISVLTVTLQDYFADLQDWLSYYHYTKLVKEVLCLTVGHYIMALRGKATGTFTFVNELVVANKIIKDRTLLEEYFEKLMEVLQRGGLRVTKTNLYYDNIENALIECLEPLLCVARILSSRNIQGVENDIKELFIRYGIDGLKLIQSCFLVNPCISKNDRWSLYEQVQKFFDDQQNKLTQQQAQQQKAAAAAASGGTSPPPIVLYVTKLSEDYRTYDANVTVDKAAASNKEVKRGIGGFWGRLTKS
jgi:hypothetical protein